jgi:hypothetical protein
MFQTGSSVVLCNEEFGQPEPLKKAAAPSGVRSGQDPNFSTGDRNRRGQVLSQLGPDKSDTLFWT